MPHSGSSLSPAQRSQRARIAAHAMHATHDSTATSAAGRAAFDERFSREVDPDGVLPVEERERRAGHARKAYFTKLALKSSKARSRRAGDAP